MTRDGEVPEVWGSAPLRRCGNRRRLEGLAVMMFRLVLMTSMVWTVRAGSCFGTAGRHQGDW